MSCFFTLHPGFSFVFSLIPFCDENIQDFRTYYPKSWVSHVQSFNISAIIISVL